MKYPVKIEKDEDGFVATFPDLDGCFTDGDTIDETLINAKEAMDGYLETVIIRQLAIPTPSKITGKNIYHIPVSKQIEFVINLKKRRQELNLTQTDVADKLGVKYQTYQKLEDITKSNPTIKTIIKLEKVMNCNFQIG